METISYEICEGRHGCTSKVAFACTCGDPIVFLCKLCVVDHLSDPVSHMFISLEQARELVRDFALNDRFHENLAKYTVLKGSIQDYISRLERYKKNLRDTKSEIIHLVVKEFNKHIEVINTIQQRAVSQLDCLKRSIRNSTMHEDETFKIYENGGLNRVMENYVQSFDIKKEEIINAVQNAFLTAPSDSIYMTEKISSILIKYDISTSQPQIIYLGNKIAESLTFSSACMLPDGNLMIVGGLNPNLGSTYKFNTKTHGCTKLRPLNTPRGLVSLICVNNYLYALGGSASATCKNAERMDWSGNGWKTLPDMREARAGSGIVCVKDRIYLIGGEQSSIEYYDIQNNTFSYVPGIQIEPSLYFAAFVDDKIYTISKSQLRIYSNSFQLIETRSLYLDNEIFCLHTPVLKGDRLYFIDYTSSSFCMLDIKNRSFSRLGIDA